MVVMGKRARRSLSNGAAARLFQHSSPVFRVGFYTTGGFNV
jgi:hypothetical protein